MALTLSGDGDITGLAVGALPSNVIDGISLLQVVQNTSSLTTSTTSSSFVDTTLSTSITPSSSTSKILVIIDASVYTQADNATYMGAQIVRGSTAVYTDNSAWGVGVNANVAVRGHIIMKYLDFHATTSTITYKLQIRRATSAGTSYPVELNPAGVNSKSSITLLEIA